MYFDVDDGAGIVVYAGLGFCYLGALCYTVRQYTVDAYSFALLFLFLAIS
jgi:hypothetical protein